MGDKFVQKLLTMEPESQANDIIIPSLFISYHTYLHLLNHQNVTVMLEANQESITIGELMGVVLMSPVVVFGVLYGIWLVGACFRQYLKRRDVKGLMDQVIPKVEYLKLLHFDSFSESCVNHTIHMCILK